MFIALEGNIGIGKTSLSKRIAKHLGYDLLLEQFEENPFLDKFYTNKELHAFDTEMWFLQSRYEHFLKLNNSTPIHLVSDYIFEKTYWFAKENLSIENFEKFNREYNKKCENILVPDFLIVLKLPMKYLLENISKRGRMNEKKIEISYLEKLNVLYDQLAQGSLVKHKLLIELKNNDFSVYDEAFDLITEKIEKLKT